MSVAHTEEPQQLAHVGPWTIADVMALPEGRHEILTEGVLTVGPNPATAHQRASRRLANLLEATATGEDVEVLEAVNVEIPGERFCIPDIAVVDAEFAATDPVMYQGHHLRAVVEIVSSNSRPQDRIIKPRLYADAGIPTYWRLELEGTPRLIVFELRRGRYVQVVTAKAGESTEVAIPFRVTIDPAVLVRAAGRAPARPGATD